MKKLSQNGNSKRLASVSVGILVANFVVALLVDQFGIPIHNNVAVTGALLLAAGINFGVSKYFK